MGQKTDPDRLLPTKRSTWRVCHTSFGTNWQCAAAKNKPNPILDAARAKVKQQVKSTPLCLAAVKTSTKKKKEKHQ
jgi:hypothetical protein